ncbi:MAG: hypothetical protein AWU55_696 [Halomonadaceae bacterium T82-2]|nr:MAG: hypothetical protein AWU55_696 [Halomonadaceae bacterium T82-2]
MASALRHRARVLTGLLRLLVWLPLWLLGLLLLLLGLALSPWGTAWLLDQGQQRDWLSYDSVTGAPLDDFTLRGLHLTAGPANVAIQRLHLAWADDCLLKGQLCLDTLQIEGADIRLQPGEAAPPPAASGSGGLPPIVVPFPVEVRELALDDVALQLADGTHLSWQQLHTGARLDRQALTLKPTELAGARLRLPSAGKASVPPAGTRSGGALSPAAVEASRALSISRAEVASSTPDASTPDARAPETREAGGSDVASGTSVAVSGNGPASADKPQSRKLPDIQLPLPIRIPELVVRDFRLEGAEPRRIDRLSLSLEGQEHRVTLEHLTLKAPQADAELTAQVRLQGDYPLNAHLTGTLHQAPLTGQHVELQARGSLSALKATLAADGPVSARLEAAANVLAPELPFDATLTASSLAWPLPDAAADKSPAPQYRVRDLTLKAAGQLSDYRVALQGQVSGRDLPDTVQVGLTGHGDSERFNWLPLSLAANGGSLVSRGEVRWSPALDVTARLDLSRFNPGLLTPAVEGSLNGQAQAHFAMADGGWSLTVPKLAVDGSLQQRPLSLQAVLQGDSGMHWRIDTLDLRQGRNRLTAEGTIADTLDLQGRLDAPALESLLPSLGGQASGQLSLGGTMKKPQVDATLTGNGLRFADNRIAELSLDARVSGVEDPDMDVALRVSDVRAAGQQLTQAEASLKGRLSDHRLAVTVNAAPGMPMSRAQLALTGGLNAARDAYRGRLEALSLETDQANLQLAQATALSVDLNAQKVQLQPFCLSRREGGRLCATRPVEAGASDGRVALSLQALPLDMANAALPDGWATGGQLDGTLGLAWSRGGQQWNADADLDGRVSLDGQNAYGQPWSLPSTELALSLSASPATADVTLKGNVGEAGRLDLQARITDPAGEAALSGKLALDGWRLAPYQPLVTSLQALEGRLDGQLALSGALANPSLDGQLTLADLRASGRNLPLSVTDGRVGVRVSGHTADLDGFVAGDKGRLTLSGQVGWPSLDQWRADVSLSAVKAPLRLAMPEFGRLDVAPDLRIQATPQRLQVRGDVTIPWARLEVGKIPPSAVSPSSDEVVITREDDARAREQARRAARKGADAASEATAQALSRVGMQLDVRVDLHIGPDVKLEAYGLTASLRGDLQVRQGNGPVQLFGDVNLLDGRYSAFGQDLVIRQGKVLFSGPASEPRLQFEAIRNPDTTQDGVIAGLRVTGPAAQPDLSVFSEPAMAESRALSYLLRGRAPDDTGGGDGALTSALIGLSLSRTGGAIGQLGQAFGVQDLSVDTAGSGEDSQVVVSGYLFDNLEVSYGVGIFSPIAELTLRYQLWQNLYVEAVSGAAQAVDLIYSFSLGRSNASP